MNIRWSADHPEADYSTRTGCDEGGNVFHLTASGELITVRTADGRTGLGWTAEEALSAARAKPLPTGTELTNDELDECIAQARANLEAAWDVQIHTTVEEGFNLEQSSAALAQAIEAEYVYFTLCAERESRAVLRSKLSTLIDTLKGSALRWSEHGPWTYAFYGSGKVGRAFQLIGFCRMHAMPWSLETVPNGIAVTFGRPHTMIVREAIAREITPEISPNHPAKQTWEGDYAEHICTPRVALHGEGRA